MSNVYFTIGCDPEFFLTQGGKYVPAINYISGMKGCPQDLGRGNGVMVDNVALEFCTEPAIKEEKFVRGIKQAIKAIKKLLPDDVKIEAIPSAYFPADALENPVCQEFGCDPDFNAYRGGRRNPRPAAEDDTFRSCGGHIHVGHPRLSTPEDRIMMVKLMDCTHGLCATTLDRGESAIARRKLYGKAGTFRPTEYGLEYRTLSNFWLKSPELVKLIYRLTRDAVSLYLLNYTPKVLGAVDEKEVVKVINSGDSEKALELFANHVVPELSAHTVEQYMDISKKVFSFESSWNY